MRSTPYQELFDKVSVRLSDTSTITDHLLLTRWRIISLCQHLYGGVRGDAEQSVIEALDLFAREGPCAESDEAINTARAVVAKETNTHYQTILPEITSSKREEVLAWLEKYEELGNEAVNRAISILPVLRRRLKEREGGVLFAGIRHRLELVASILINGSISTKQRLRAAAAILYLDEIEDTIPDTIGYIGLLDDDYALRVALENTGILSREQTLFWAEKISSALWDDLPFLRKVQLRRNNQALATNWLDRLNSYFIYTNALNKAKLLLIYLQPTIACSPIHSIVTLVGLIVLEGITSSINLIKSLKVGQVYGIDGKYYARYKGIDTETAPGWVILEFKDSVDYRPPVIANRMTLASSKSPSSIRKFTEHVHHGDKDPIQSFFDWKEAIGTALLSARVLLVTSQERAGTLFRGIESNNVGLLEGGIIGFIGDKPAPDVMRKGLILVVPSLSTARRLLEEGMDIKAIIVDGCERLNRGRHDLPFIQLSSSPPPIIVWTTKGYSQTLSYNWLPPHRRVEVPQEELAHILELDGDMNESALSSQTSLWEAATASGIKKVISNWTESEQELIKALDIFKQLVSSSPVLPSYWKYHLFTSSMVFRALVTATPALWCDIRDYANAWIKAIRDQWTELRSRVIISLAEADEQLDIISLIINGTQEHINSKADALLNVTSKNRSKALLVVCDLTEQVKLIGQLEKNMGAANYRSILLKNLNVCESCIVVGWRNQLFGYRLWDHAPSKVIALVSESEGVQWDRLEELRRARKDESILDAVGYKLSTSTYRVEKYVAKASEEEMTDEELILDEDSFVDDSEGPTRVSCVCIWLSGESEGKILALNSLVLLEDSEKPKERSAKQIVPGDRVILASGNSRWSPADDFTQAVVEAIEEAHPKLVQDAREWRFALKRLKQDRVWSTAELLEQLKGVGVYREQQTVEGWLELDRAAPISPMRIRKELQAIWELVNQFTNMKAQEAVMACSRLKSLRMRAGRSLLRLWQGQPASLDIDTERLEEIVEQLRQSVQIYEVDAVSYGDVHPAMLGWWIKPELASIYGIEAGQTVADSHSKN